jgi:BTG family
MALSTSTNLNATLSNAISYLMRPLLQSYPTTTLVKLQLVLEANLTAFYAPTWVINDPLRGSGRRCLSFSPNCLPPRPVYAACLAAGVQWFEWIALLGGREFDFFVDPGSVSVRFGKKGVAPLFTVWSDKVDLVAATKAHAADASRLKAQLNAQAEVFQVRPRKTVAQLILEEDSEEDDELFALLADELSVSSSWKTPIIDHFPVSARSTSPLSDISDISRSSSASSGISFASSATSYASSIRKTPTLAPASSPNAPTANAPYKMSRRERARQARVFIDQTKTDVTPYDGGKTTVLTGGVMLGGAPKPRMQQPPAKRQLSATVTNWRAVRA